MNSYIVSKSDIEINLERIKQSILIKPDWHKYNMVSLCLLKSGILSLNS
jgi:hypothetical protein